MMTWGWKIRPNLLDYPQPLTSCSHLSQTTNSVRGQILVKQLKNRYTTDLNQRFVVGIDRSKMRLFDVDQNDSPLNKEVDDGPAFDNSTTGLINTEKFADFTL